MISIIMPVYNVEKYIEKTLESIKNQTYSDFEVIMVDDGSTDSSGLICDKWTQADPRFKVIHKENAGVSAARNTALSFVKGEYVFFMDSNDVIQQETLKELIVSFNEKQEDSAKNDLYCSDSNGNPFIKINKKYPENSVTVIDALVTSFINCVKNVYYYGKNKTKIDNFIKFFIKYSPSVFSADNSCKRIILTGRIISIVPDIYAKYISFCVKKDYEGITEAIRCLIFDFIFKFFSYFPAKNRIIFESKPEMTCNTYPVYKYLLEQGINEKYEFVWLSKDAGKYNKNNFANTSFINHTSSAKSFTEKLKTMYYIATAKALIYSNQLLGCHGKNKISLWLQHGMPLKASNGTYCIKNQCTASLCMSEFFKENFSADARVEEDKMIFMGFPRNDLLLTDNDSLAKFGFDKYDKVIFWLPTFRQRANVSKKSKLNDFEMEVKGTGIPSIETAEEMKKVNEYLKANNCLLVLKPHPVQDMSAMKESSLSNFFIINDNTLKEKGVQLYELLGRCDAMITDYSSVFYDFLITDKPIGLTTGDIDEYIAKRGFVYKNPLDILKGEYIYNTDGLITFIGNVINNNDVAKEERTAVKNMIHAIKTPDSAKLVGDYIISQLKNIN